LSTLSRTECANFRKDLLRYRDDYHFAWFLRALAKPQHCDPAIYAETDPNAGHEGQDDPTQASARDSRGRHVARPAPEAAAGTQKGFG